MSAELMIELWQDIKHYIPSKDRIDVADLVVKKFDEYGLSDGIENEVGLDKTLKTAVISYYHLEEDEEEHD